MNGPQKHTYVITGGTRGIGRATALALAHTPGNTLILTYLQNDTKAEATAKEVRSLGATCILSRGNIGDPETVETLFRKTVPAVCEHVDGLVHCAALTAFKPAMAVRLNHWDLTMNMNARAFLHCVQECRPLMHGGSIVAISSLGSGRALPSYAAMGPTKAALESLVRYLAVELIASGIRVNGVSAGPVDTESLDAFPDAAQLKSEGIARTPSKRLGTPDDVADVICFLLGPASRWIVGQIVVADGGFSIV